MEICHRMLLAFSARPIRLTAGDGGPSTGCHTHSNAKSCFI